MKKTRFLLFVAVLGMLLLCVLGSWMTHPAPTVIGGPPADLPVRSVTIPSQSGSNLRGWFVPGRQGSGAILLLHAVRASRLAMLDRARFLHRAGYSVLLVDFQAHGESPGQHITFGALESRDARAAARYLRQQVQGEKIGVIGVSLGGAAALLGPTPLPVQALILESVYPTIEEALTNRLRLHFGEWATVLLPPLLLQIRWQLGIAAEDLHPIERIGSVGAPVLIIAGSQDQHTTVAESLRLFGAASGPKEWWGIDGASHTDFYQFAPQEYTTRVLTFFAQHLRARHSQ
ncbi:MAG: alpha/beta hydrolase [Candidatus Binatia bacterium]